MLRTALLLLLFTSLAAADDLGLDGAVPGRAQLIDIDGDGWLDLVVCGQPPNVPGALRIYRSMPQGKGRTFVDWTQHARLWKRADVSGGRQSSFVVWGDVDNDGILDAISVAQQDAKAHTAGPQTHRCYLGTGRGRFAMVEDSGVERKGHRATMAAVLADLDLDGRLDVAFANTYDHYGKSLVAQQLRAYRGMGGGKFLESTKVWGLLTPGAPGAADAARPLFGLTAADINGDGWPDLLGAAYGRQWNTAWVRDPAKAVFVDRARELGIDGDAIRHGKYPAWMQKWWTARYKKPRADERPFRSNGNTFALVAGDVDGDGDLDLFSADITHAWAGEASDLSALLLNEGGKFVRQLEKLEKPDPQTGLRWRPTRGLARDHAPQEVRRWNQGDLQAHFADLDNDGRLDLLVCESDYPHNRLRIFLQTAPLRFTESAAKLGIVWPNCPGLALGDIDRDGDLDLVATGTRTRWKQARPRNQLRVFDGKAAAGTHGFLWIKLVGGENANRNGIGAKLVLTTDEGTQTREAQGPYGHWSAQRHPGEVHFGLGAAAPKTLVVTWPDAERSSTTLKELPTRGWIVIRQGAEPVVLTTFDPAKWSPPVKQKK